MNLCRALLHFPDYCKPIFNIMTNRNIGCETSNGELRGSKRCLIAETLGPIDSFHLDSLHRYSMLDARYSFPLFFCLPALQRSPYCFTYVCSLCTDLFSINYHVRRIDTLALSLQD